MVEPDTTKEKKYEKVLAEFESKCSAENHEIHLSYGYGVRHLQTLMLFMSLCIIFMARAHINATIVAMTDVPKDLLLDTAVKDLEENNRDITNLNANSEDFNITKDKNINKLDLHFKNDVKYDDTNLNDTKGTICKENSLDATVCEKFGYSQNMTHNGSSLWNVYRVYAWPKRIQEMVLGSFFLGYMVMMSPMGLVCQRWGGKLPLQISLFSSAFITFFTPWLAAIGDYKAVCFTRVAVGLVQAGTYPSVNALIAKWIPVCERGRLGTYVYSGGLLGSILCYHISGFLAVSWFGWPSIFWVIGTLCLLVGLLTTWFVAPSPQQHRYISEEEKNFILGGKKDQTQKRLPTPWKAIMTSKPILACFTAHVGCSTMFYFLFSQIPTYLHHAVGLNVKESGLLTSLPYLCNFIASICLGVLSDYCVNRNILTLKQVRIASNSLATVGSAITMYALTYISSPVLAVTCIVICMAAQAGTYTAWMINYIDLAPNFSGTLMATGNTLMNIFILLLPVLVSNVITDMTNVYQWRIVLFVVGTFGLLTNIVYVLFASADVQPWNDSKYEPTAQEDPDTKKDKDAK